MLIKFLSKEINSIYNESFALSAPIFENIRRIIINIVVVFILIDCFVGKSDQQLNYK